MRLKDTIHMLKKYGLAGLDEDHNQHQQYKPSTNRNAKAIRRPLFPDDDDG
jgi:hypothetical protein